MNTHIIASATEKMATFAKQAASTFYAYYSPYAAQAVSLFWSVFGPAARYNFRNPEYAYAALMKP